MRIVSFNVNGVRSRLHQLKELISQYQPDIIGLQETKVIDDLFPIEAINEMGYQAEYYGQKGHYGVALLSKQPALRCIKGFEGDDEEAHKRWIVGEYAAGDQTLVVCNGYFPQGESRNHPDKFPNKQRFYAGTLDFLQQRSPDQPIVVMGDMNVSHTDNDIGIGEENRKRWLRTGKCSFLPEEREWLNRLLDWGLVDTFRQHFPDVKDRYSWFDYRSRGFEDDPKRGLRIDLILATQPLAARCVDAGVSYEIRGMEKASDHCPIWADFDLK
ncbi:exodeoxyribonuclease III [Hahella sp. KA22]|uniref:exodeoxyribonuclease III n=1 Tax=Hahella sp. KA22 TaxID=1628392 RepID=UPI000FDF1090|nr:exodeoxyribonuclease III [Hahella sp. KA22]AZZ92969.1 exodeoxyribonuclease III [Hahella sp. KA22]QAY56343.1 exodeoxyribonuclease III [Hahella sp. KA22]